MTTHFVVVGEQGAIATSDDGITWTAQTTGLAFDDVLYEVAHSPEQDRWVAVGLDYDLPGGTIGVSDDDGVTWSWSAQSEPIHCIAWSADLGLWLAGGYDDTLLTSPDAATWTPRTSTFGSGAEIVEAVWDCTNGLFHIMTSDGRLAHSTDGTTWTYWASNGTAYALTFAPGPGLLLQGHDFWDVSIWDGTTFAYSYPSFGSIHDLVWAPELDLFVMAASSGSTGTIATSPDGSPDGGATSWTSRLTSTPVRGLAWSSDLGVGVGVGYDGTLGASTVYSTTDALAWAGRTSPFGDVVLLAVAPRSLPSCAQGTDCWSWTQVGALPGSTSQKGEYGVVAEGRLFMAREFAQIVTSVAWPSLDDLQTHTLLFDPDADRRITGMTLLPDGRIVCAIRVSSFDDGGEILSFDPADIGAGFTTEVFLNHQPDFDGIIQGGLSYNPTDGKVYISDTFGWNGATEWKGGIRSFDPANGWAEAKVVELSAPNQFRMLNGCSVDPSDGTVWAVAGPTTGVDYWMLVCYDPETGNHFTFTDAEGFDGSVLDFTTNAIPVPGGGVLLWTLEGEGGDVYRYWFTGAGIARERLPVADVDPDDGPWWQGSYPDAEYETGIAFYYGDMWTYSAICATLGPTVGYIGAGLMA